MTEPRTRDGLSLADQECLGHALGVLRRYGRYIGDKLKEHRRDPFALDSVVGALHDLSHAGVIVGAKGQGEQVRR